ncbi:hypothetical protein HAX54_025802 [Datura stramonium]|uniref:non-specific serine/threonine protein kinase n=1 Tax=Datura stramonium TaxID=4076 RepID=A0ABS8V252_DATST|nr:hypothetical protein [Datura stramonium]
MRWDGFPTTRCCQNTLNFLSGIGQTGNSAREWPVPQGDQWGHCASGPFKHQPSVSINKCGLDPYQGSSQCSSLSLTDIVQDQNFKDVRDNCSGFSSSNFDDACRDCTTAIKSTRDHFLHQFNAKDNETESAICLVAVVISVATAKLNDPSLMDDFFRCLPALNTLEKSSEKYIKISRIGCNHFSNIWDDDGDLAWLYTFSKLRSNAINFGDEKEIPGDAVVQGKELENLSRVRHPNLVCLFGCCIEDGEQYLVYEYCSAGNLAQHLLRKDRVHKLETKGKHLKKRLCTCIEVSS